jgi:hypothetical protein
MLCNGRDSSLLDLGSADQCMEDCDVGCEGDLSRELVFRNATLRHKRSRCRPWAFGWEMRLGARDP